MISLTLVVFVCVCWLVNEYVQVGETHYGNCLVIYAAVNGNLDPTLSKGRQAFGVNSTSHLHLQKIEVG